MKVVTPQTIDLEITQYLIHSGHDRDTAVGNISVFLIDLHHKKQINIPTVVPVINSPTQLSVTFKMPGQSSVFSKIYVATRSSKSRISVLPPSKPKTTTVPVKKGINLITPKIKKRVKKSDEINDAWDRAMRGI